MSLATPPPPDGTFPKFQSDSIGQYIVVTCGDIEGKLYLSKFAKESPSSKCIFHHSKWCSLVEFESLGGRSKSRFQKLEKVIKA